MQQELIDALRLENILYKETKRIIRRERAANWRKNHPGYAAEVCRNNYQKNREKRILQAREYRVEHKQEINQKDREDYALNREKFSMLNKEYYAKNKEEINARVKEYRLNHKELVAAQYKAYHEKNRERRIDYSHTYYLNNKERMNKQAQEYYEANKDTILPRTRAYWQANKEQFLKDHSEYYQKNKKVLNEKMRLYLKDRRRADPYYNMTCCLRTRLYIALHSQNIEKLKTSDEYGINYKAIAEHLGMPPDDGKKYTIDHIIPLAFFDLRNPEEIKEAFKPENHQWLTRPENCAKNSKVDGVKYYHKKAA